MNPPKIKVRAKQSGKFIAPQKERQAEPKHQKGLIQKIMEIVSSDIKHLPDKIWGVRKKITMPESKESWKDWEGQI